MNKDTIKGKLTEAKGTVKKAVGRVADDPSLELEGAVDQAKGKAQQVKGHLKDAIGDMTR